MITIIYIKKNEIYLITFTFLLKKSMEKNKIFGTKFKDTDRSSITLYYNEDMGSCYMNTGFFENNSNMSCGDRSVYNKLHYYKRNITKVECKNEAEIFLKNFEESSNSTSSDYIKTQIKSIVNINDKKIKEFNHFKEKTILNDFNNFYLKFKNNFNKNEIVNEKKNILGFTIKYLYYETWWNLEQDCNTNIEFPFRVWMEKFDINHYKYGCLIEKNKKVHWEIPYLIDLIETSSNNKLKYELYVERHDI